MSKPKIFISYSHVDKRWKTLIKEFFSINEKFDLWHDGDIKLGENWFEKIKDSLHEADIALLLISKDFLNSIFIKNEEIPDFLKRCKCGKVQVIPIYIRHFPKQIVPNWLLKPNESLQGFPTPDKPLCDLNKNQREKSLSKLVDKVYENFDNQILQNLEEEQRKTYQPIIDNLNKKNITTEKLLQSCKNFLDKNLFLRIKKYRTIDEIINHISEDEKFDCIIKELHTNDNECFEYYPQPEQIEKKPIKEPQLVIIFRSQIDNQYEITFRAKDLPYKINENDSIVYDLENDKDKLIEKIMSYVGTCNPKVDLILPAKLMTKDINLWEVEFNESLSRLSKINIRDYGRYNSSVKIFEDVIKPQWEKVEKKINTNKKLRLIKCENDIKNIGNNLEECGLSSKYLLQEKHIKFLLKTDMSYIMLWLTKDSNHNLKDLYDKDISILQDEYFKLQSDPISLMWDDPNTYYYPDENKQGE